MVKRILWAWTIIACMVLLALAVLCGIIDQAHHPPGEDVIASMDGDSSLSGLYDQYTTTDAPAFIEQDDEATMVLTCFTVTPCEQTNVSRKFADKNRYDENTNNERSGRLLWYYFANRGEPLHRWIQA